MSVRQIVLTGLLVVALALLGVWLGRMLQPAPHQSGAELHALMHKELDLDPAQERALSAIEADFAAERTRLENALKASNARLAEAIAAEHEYGPRVAEAVDQTHHAMGDLQKATLEHVFAMRAILRSDKQARFDEVVSKSLASPEQ